MEDELELIEATYPKAVEIEGNFWRLSLSPSVEISIYYEGALCGKLRHLPPISLSGEGLDCEGIREFFLEVSFLAQETINQLRDKLEEIARESVAMVFFEWLSFLDTELRDFLGDRINIPSEQLACQLLAFDKKRATEQFALESHTCTLCFEEKAGSRFTQLNCRERRENGQSQESHYFCTECLQSMAKVNVDEGAFHALKCPSTDCKIAFPEYILRELLDGDRYNRWERLVTSKAIGQMSDIVYCPTCAFLRKLEVPVIEDADHLARCNQCDYIFCGLCKLPYHTGPCISDAEQIHLLERREGTTDKETSKHIFNEILNVKYLTAQGSNLRSCPSCKMKVEKIDGCNKMTCGNCSVKFCWKCSKEISGYDHFDGNCVLFEDAAIRDWEQQWQRRVAGNQERRIRNEAMQEVYPNHQMASCPRCRAQTIYGNNNNIRCWNCDLGFCRLCRAGYANFAAHFKPKGNCPQHGDPSPSG